MSFELNKGLLPRTYREYREQEAVLGVQLDSSGRFHRLSSRHHVHSTRCDVASSIGRNRPERPKGNCKLFNNFWKLIKKDFQIFLIMQKKHLRQVGRCWRNASRLETQRRRSYFGTFTPLRGMREPINLTSLQILCMRLRRS